MNEKDYALPFKQWLAQVGYDRIQEIENPELSQERMKELYELKGYPIFLDHCHPTLLSTKALCHGG